MGRSKYDIERRFQQRVTLVAIGFLIAVGGSLIPHFWWMGGGGENQGIFRALALGMFILLAVSLCLMSVDSIARDIQQHLNWSTKTYLSYWTLAVGCSLAGWAIPMVVGGR